MASLIGYLTDKRGNVLPNVTIISRISSNPAGDTANTTSDNRGYYEMSVSSSGTKYNIYVNSEEGGINGPNYIGSLISSGNISTSFVLGNDSTFKIEHYGNAEAESIGTHKSIIADDVNIRTNGFVKTENTFIDFKIGNDNRRLKIDGSIADNVLWLNPRPYNGNDDYDLGLKEDYDDNINYFYFGVDKEHYINTEGNFVLEDGTFKGNVVFEDDCTIDGIFTFDSINGYPQLDSYVEPTDNRQLSPKKYVDDRIAEYSLIGDSVWKNPVLVLNMIGDSDMGGNTPESVYQGDSYVANNWGGGYTDGRIYEYNGSNWVDIGILTAGDRVIVVSAGAIGSFVGKENNIGIYEGDGNWEFLTPSDGWVTQIIGINCQNEGEGYSYNSNLGGWRLFIPIP